MLLETLLKAFLIVALPITLVVYACVYVGARADELQGKVPPRDEKQ